MSGPEKKDHKDMLIERGVKQPRPLGTTIFIGLRSANILLQYGILARGLGDSFLQNTVGIKTLAQGPPGITGTILDSLEMSPYRLILLAMSTGAMLKQNWWITSISEEGLSPSAAFEVSAFNTFSDSVNSFLFVCAATSASANGEGFPQTPLLVGSGFYVVGLLTEAFSEWQRKQFKKKPENKGKVYTGGLFGLARHVNYAGYTLWRTGYTLAAGGWVAGAVVAGFLTLQFALGSIPELDSYCSGRYGEKWQQYKEKTPFKLLPYIY